MNKQYDNIMKKQMIDNGKKEIYNDVLNDLQDYILYENTIQRALQHKMINNNLRNVSNQYKFEKNKEKQLIFVPREKDTLFWCFYIMKYGESKYESLYSKKS